MAEKENSNKIPLQVQSWAQITGLISSLIIGFKKIEDTDQSETDLTAAKSRRLQISIHPS